MITKAIAEAVIHNATEDSLKEFANITMNHLINNYRFDEAAANNALEVLLGVANGYREEHIDFDKLLDYVKKYGYKAENVTDCKICYIDTLALRVNVEYVYDTENNHKTNIDIPIDEVKKE